MGADVTLVLQQGVFAALDAHAGLGALVTGVYDVPPPNTALPYVTLGDDTQDWHGTMGVDWADATVTIHSWGYGESRKQVKEVMAEVANALHKQALTVPGKTHVSTLLEFSDTGVEDDGVYHGIQRFRVIVHEPF